MSESCLEISEPCCSKSFTDDSSKMKQVTLENMKCVVVMSEILQHKSVLEDQLSSPKQIISSLYRLGKKVPPKHVLRETKLGKLVKRMTKSVDLDIRMSARCVYSKWKSYYKQFHLADKIDVLCDSTTEKQRFEQRNRLTKALKLKETNDLVYQIEKEAFLQSGRLNTQQYRQCMSDIVTILIEKKCLRYKMKLGKICVKDFVKQYIEV
ncbi:Transcription elongation factor A N-terminal and central domain-containing protein 2 [Mactra antiquata]